MAVTRLSLAATVVVLATSCGAPPEEPPPIPGDVWDEAVLPTSGATGWTDGAWSVEDDGSASYRIPMWVPPGRNGMQPELALTYNSRSPNGLVGVGWQLAGLSSIAPCARTVLSDGEHDAEVARLAGDDRLCMDGQHLVPVEPGTPGGGDFRVFRAGVTRIDRLRFGFRAYLSDGRIITYGNRVDSTIEGVAETHDAGGTVTATRRVTLAWMVSRAEDRFGNAMDYHYDWSLVREPTVVGLPLIATEWFPTRITYTHGSGPARREVRFIYEHTPFAPRADASYSFVRGAATVQLRRLASVQMFAPIRPGGAPVRVRSYRIAYRDSIVTSRSLVESVRECDGLDVCREPIDLRWTQIEPLLATPRGPTYAQSPARVFFPARVDEWGTALSADFFGVGRDYGLRRDTAEWLATGQTAGAAWETLRVPLSPTSALVPFDIEGDGRSELLEYDARAAGAMQVRLLALDRALGAPAIGIRVLATLEPVCSSDERVFPMSGDVDGDGLTDLIHACRSALGGSSTWTWSRRARGAPISFEAARRLATSASPLDVLLSDLNGDGRVDITTGSTNVGLLRGETEWGPTGVAVPPANQRRLSFDVNGDGLPDWVEITDTANLVVRLNTGGGLAEGYLAASEDDLPEDFTDHLTGGACRYSALHRGDFRFADYDGDGREDLIAFQDSFARHPDQQDVNVVESYPDDHAQQTTIPPGRRVIQGCEPRTIIYRSDGRTFHATLPTETVRPVSGAPYTYYLRPGTSARYNIELTPGAYAPQFCVRSSEIRSQAPCYRSWPSVHLLRRGDAIVMLSEVDAPENRAPNLFKVDEFHRVAPDLMRSASRSGQRDVRFGYGLRFFDSLRCGLDRCGGSVRVVTDHTDELGARFEHDYLYPRTATNGEGWLGFLVHQVRDQAATQILTRFHDMTEEPGFGHPYAAHVQREIVWARDAGFRASLYWDTQTVREIRPLSTGGAFVPMVSSEHSTWHIAEPPPACVERPCLTEVLAPITSRPPLTVSTRSIEYSPTGAIESEVDEVHGVERRIAQIAAYDDRPDAWQFRLPLDLVVRMEVASGRAATVRTRYRWSDEGEARQILTDLHTTTIDRTSAGLVERITVEGVDGVMRSTSYAMDPAEGMFQEQTTNGAGHVSRVAHLPSTGEPVFVVDPGGIETRLSYDGLARLRRRTHTGIDELLDYETGPTGIAPAALATQGVRVTRPGGIDVVRYSDRFERFHQRVHRGWRGNVVEAVEYDERGRPRAHHTPHYEAASTYRIERVTYDDADRPRFVLSGVAGELSFTEYDGLSETTRTPSGIVSTITHDAMGRIARSRQPAGDDEGASVLEYTYGPGGVLESIADRRSNRWRTEFDAHLRSIGTFDPDSGWRCVARNSIGEMTHDLDGSELESEPCSGFAGPTTDPVAEYRHDAIGRVTDVFHRADGRTEFVWDTAADGLLERATRHGDGVSSSYTYDTHHRLATITTQIVDRAYELGYGYDAAGRIREITYPATASGRLVVRQEYDDARGGALRQVRDVGRDAVLWQARDEDALGRVVESRQGLGLSVRRRRTFDPASDRLTRLLSTAGTAGRLLQDERLVWSAEGDLRSRRDAVLGRDWTYTYDRRHRLSRYSAEDAVHRYDYDDRGNAILFDNVRQRFDDGAHRLTGRAEVARGFANYDLEGRRIATVGGIHVSSYNQFDLPVEVAAGGPNGARTRYRYDAHGQRVESVSQFGSEVIIGPFRETAGGHTAQIEAGGEVVVEIVTSGTASRTYSILGDHLGSPSAVVDERGEVVERYEFDPFGARQRLAPDGAPAPTPGALVSDGFTGHDQEEQVGAIDMGGRFFEPSTGQFLSPDPYVQSWVDRDSMNGYAYARQNPLRFVDPSGLNRAPWEDPGGGPQQPPAYGDGSPLPGAPGPGPGMGGDGTGEHRDFVDSTETARNRRPSSQQPSNEPRVAGGGSVRVGESQHGGLLAPMIVPVQTGLPPITPGREGYADNWFSRTTIARAEALRTLEEARALLERARPGAANPLSASERQRLTTAMREWFREDVTPESITRLQERLQAATNQLRSQPIHIVRSEADLARLPSRERERLAAEFFDEENPNHWHNAAALPGYIALGPDAFDWGGASEGTLSEPTLASILIHEADHYQQPADMADEDSHPQGRPDMNPRALQGFLADSARMRISPRYRQHLRRTGRPPQ